MGLSLSTLERAYIYVDILIASYLTPTEALYLIGTVALLFSSKVNMIDIALKEWFSIHKWYNKYYWLNADLRIVFVNQYRISSNWKIQCDYNNDMFRLRKTQSTKLKFDKALINIWEMLTQERSMQIILIRNRKFLQVPWILLTSLLQVIILQILYQLKSLLHKQKSIRSKEHF